MEAEGGARLQETFCVGENFSPETQICISQLWHQRRADKVGVQ